MAQYKLKLLTILTNLLITHLSFISSEKTHDFVTNIITLVANDGGVALNDDTERAYHSIKDKIPQILSGDKNPVLTFGFNLLLELSYIFIVTCKSEDVLPTELRQMIVQEYSSIMRALICSDRIFKAKTMDQERVTISD